MNLHKQTIDDISLSGKRVIIRADFNVPLDDSLQITDDTRIRSTLPTINRVVDDGGKAIVCSHLTPRASSIPNSVWRPSQSGSDDARQDVIFAPDCIGPNIESLVAKMKPGDVMLLENLRFHSGETNDETFSKSLAALGDVYINDAFGAAHRAHASTVGITKHIPVAAVISAQKEIEYQGAVENPVRPFVAISAAQGLRQNRRDRKPRQARRQGHHRRRHGISPFRRQKGSKSATRWLKTTCWISKGHRRPCVLARRQILSPGRLRRRRQRETSAETKIVPVQEIPKGWKGASTSVRPRSSCLRKRAECQDYPLDGPMGVFEVDAFARAALSRSRMRLPMPMRLPSSAAARPPWRSIEPGIEKFLHFHRRRRGTRILLEGKPLPGLVALPERND